MEARTEIPPSEGRRDTGGGDAAHSLPVEPSGASGSGSTVQPKPAGLSGWFAELKRRRVVRTLVGYGIASFVVLNVAATAKLYPLSLHDALPSCGPELPAGRRQQTLERC